MRSLLRSLALALLMLVGASQARAQDYPNRPITLIVPFPAGGSTTVMARNVADKMSTLLGQNIVVENRAGAGGTIGTRQAAKSPPDGYTIVLGYTGTFSIAPSLYADPGYDPRKDFAPIGLIGTAPSVMVVHPSVPVKSVAEFVAYAKAQAQPVSYGSPGVGTANHLAGELFASATGVKLQHIPYKGSGPAMTDLIGGRVNFLCEIITTAKPQIDGGTVKVIANLSRTRSPALPNVPTAVEQGTDVEAYTWNAFFLPKGASPELVKKLNGVTIEAMKAPAVRTKLEGLGAVFVAEDRTKPEYLGKFVRSEIEKWAKPIKASGVSAD